MFNVYITLTACNVESINTFILISMICYVIVFTENGKHWGTNFEGNHPPM